MLHDMPASDTGKTKTLPTCSGKEAGTGKEISAIQADQPDTRSSQHGALKMKSRKVKTPGDVDSDYAEEAEDFYYGEGM